MCSEIGDSVDEGDGKESVDGEVDREPERERGPDSNLVHLGDVFEGVSSHLDVKEDVLDSEATVGSLDRGAVGDQEDDPKENSEEELVARDSDAVGVEVGHEASMSVGRPLVL